MSRQQITVLNHERKSRYFSEYGFAVYNNNEEAQKLLEEINHTGSIVSFELEDDDSELKLYINGYMISNLTADDMNFIHVIKDQLGLVYAFPKVLEPGDDNYPGSKLRSTNCKDVYYLVIMLYYFDKVISVEKRTQVIDKELNYDMPTRKIEGRKVGIRSAKFMIALNIILVIICVCLAIYCYMVQLKGYGIFMVAFAIFFASAAWKYTKMKKE